jgi:hypothetical protein
MKRRAAAVVSGAAPDITQRSELVSYFASVAAGSEHNRMNIVGTISVHVMRSRSMICRHASGSKWFWSTTVAPRADMIATNAGAAL